MDKTIQLIKQVRFGGHRIAHSIRVSTPIKLTEPIPIEVFYFNEGTEKQARKSIVRKVSFAVNPEELKEDEPFVLKFKFELKELPFRLDRDDVFIRQPFSFHHKKP